MSGEAKADAVLGSVASAAGVAGTIPTPASPALLLFSEIEPLVGPEIVHLFASLFHRIKGAKNPKAAAQIVVVAGHVTMDNVDDIGNIDPTGQGKEV